MSLFTYNASVQADYEREFRNKDIEIARLKYELEKKNERIEKLEKCNKERLQDYENMRDRYFAIMEK